MAHKLKAPFDDPHWHRLAQHVASCKISSCQCKLFYRNYSTWSVQLPGDPEMKEPTANDSWLWFSLSGPNDINFRWLCLFCHAEHSKSADHDFRVSNLRVSNLLVHHGSSMHRQQVSQQLGISLGSHFTHPSHELFKELLASFKQGCSISSGFDLPSGRISDEKAYRMLWTMYEGNNDIKREHLREADFLGFFRDERHSVCMLDSGALGTNLNRTQATLAKVAIMSQTLLVLRKLL